jgi:hypothetical protein
MHLQKATEKICAEDFRHAILVPPFNPGYSILFGTLDFFVFIKRFVMIYERFMIAKRQITEKVADDINSAKTLELIQKETGLSRERVAE